MNNEPPESTGDRREHKSAHPTGSVWIKVAVLAVTLFWIAMTWSLLRREVFLPRLPRPRMDSSAARITFDSLPRDTWMGIYFSDGRKVGFSHSLIEARGDRPQDGYLVTSTTHMVMSFLANSSTIDVDARAELSGTGSFERFFIDLKSGPASFRAEAQVVDGKTRFTVTTGGSTRTFDMASTPDALLADSMSPLLGATQLRTGVTYRANLLDPLSFASNPARVTRVGREPVLIGAKKVEADRIVIKYQGIETTAWIIDSGEVVRVDTAMGLSMVREPEKMARDMSSVGAVTRGAPADLARFAVTPAGKR
ncbi:MAG: hypothetical protein J7M12_06505, partial [Candidatus Hydrogenedentes bacterium]|nr:hypothetical protein [Candidatus Hydrogenedentota bacterium]